MTAPKGEPTPRGLKLAITVLANRIPGTEITAAVSAAITTLERISDAYESGRLDWCDELAKVRAQKPTPGPTYGGYGGGPGLVAEATSDLENLARRGHSDSDIRP